MTSTFGSAPDSNLIGAMESSLGAIVTEEMTVRCALHSSHSQGLMWPSIDLSELAPAALTEHFGHLDHMVAPINLGAFVSARTFLASDADGRCSEDSMECFAIWEDQLDALGSEPSLLDLKNLIDRAPTRNHPLYRFASCIYTERLQEAIMAWEDELDSLGANPLTADLERLVAMAPDPLQEIVIYVQGFLAQRHMME